MMVSFDSCEGNPGALSFMMEAYQLDMWRAERGFNRVIAAGVTGSRLYMLWNDCCDRDTAFAIDAMNNKSISDILEAIKGDGYRGYRFRRNPL